MSNLSYLIHLNIILYLKKWIDGSQNNCKLNMVQFLKPTPSEIFLSIYNKLNDDGHFKFDNSNGSYNPVLVKLVSDVIFESENYKKVSLSHCYEYNGELMCDPEMCFLFNPEFPEKIIPCSFKLIGTNGGNAFDSISFNEAGIAFEWKRSMQASHTMIANLWLEAIMVQQKIIL